MRPLLAILIMLGATAVFASPTPTASPSPTHPPVTPTPHPSATVFSEYNGMQNVTVIINPCSGAVATPTATP